MKHLRIATYAIMILAAVSCSKDKGREPESGPAAPIYGLYMINEGAFGGQNASVDFWHEDGTVSHDPYFEANGVPMGDVLQSAMVYGNRVFAVLNNSQRVVVFDANSFEDRGSIDGLSYPRHMVASGNHGYITDGSFDGYVRVVDMGTLDVISSIPVGMGPERLLIHGDRLFVCNSGGWANDNTVSVIDLDSQSVIETIQVTDRPVDVVADADGKLWVLCSGNVLYDDQWNVTGHTLPFLYRIDPETLAVEVQAQAGVEGDHPQSLAISSDAETVFYVNENLMKLDINNPNDEPVMFSGGPYHTVDVDPVSGNIYLTTIPDFVTPSSVIELSSDGFVVSAIEAGIGTNAVVPKL